jgi:hypothetical protein
VPAAGESFRHPDKGRLKPRRQSGKARKLEDTPKLKQRGQNGIKPNALNIFVLNDIAQKPANQTHGKYPIIFQSLGVS